MSKIQTAINGAMRDIARIGIGKTKTADTGQAKYKFRGVEDAMNEMSPIMVNHGITVAARYSDLMITERDKGGGKATRFVTLKGTFTFSAEDDSSITAEAYGEAMDSGDKATIKAQSVAFRTALFQLFVVPTMSMDTELDDHDDGATDAEEQMLADFRDRALQGTDALRKHYSDIAPNEVFWRRHGASLKAAAAEADKAAA